MNAIDFFDSDELELPRSRDIDDFEGYIKGLFDGFLSKFGMLRSRDYITKQIRANKGKAEDVCGHLREAIAHAFRGLSHMAYREMSAAIRCARPHFGRLCTPQSIAGTPPMDQLYRVRVENDPCTGFQKPDMFHIPFEKRHLVARQRYSLPGLPCLYLGGSLYVCWEELGRPEFHRIHLARFRPSSGATLTVLGFGYRPGLMAAMINANQAKCQTKTKVADFAVAQAVCWPLLAACSIQRRHGNSPFIAEYIVPQLLLQWITHSSKHDGIRYFSANIDAYHDSPGLACNYVFPARDFAAKGHCARLRSKFEMSEPISWQLLAPTPMAAMQPVHGGSEVELAPGTRVKYVDTPFGQIEARGLHFPCTSF